MLSLHVSSMRRWIISAISDIFRPFPIVCTSQPAGIVRPVPGIEWFDYRYSSGYKKGRFSDLPFLVPAAGAEPVPFFSSPQRTRSLTHKNTSLLSLDKVDFFDYLCRNLKHKTG